MEHVRKQGVTNVREVEDVLLAREADTPAACTPATDTPAVPGRKESAHTTAATLVSPNSDLGSGVMRSRAQRIENRSGLRATPSPWEFKQGGRGTEA